ncbi:MAG: glycosyltransferase family 4 protein, partial [Treponema sp.]|nr:glycosyltransferase family 4 protein [Treponema sp.]
DVGEIKGGIKAEMYKFIEDFGIDLIIPENALAIPMHIPLGLAITELVAETEMPTIAHHHDFFWERPRFLTGCAEDYLGRSFPPKLHSISHVVINTEARQQLAFRCGLSSFMIPNVWDFHAEPVKPDAYNATFRRDFGLSEDDIIFLQPTRIVARKGIENAIELVARFNRSPEGAGRGKILVSHPELDEGNAYFNRITDYAAILEVPLLIRPDLLAPERGVRPDGGKVYSLWDAYVACDFVTYPSTYEGFGNAFLEAVYYRKPILVNQYAIYAQDIDPIGFKVVSIDGYITRDTVSQTAELLADPGMREEWAEHNFRLGSRFFSYDVLRKRLPYLFMNFGAVS